jgi:multidrug resistance efflux pump
MKKVFIFLINTFYFIFVIALAFSISTIALTRKVNESKAFINNLNGSVVKEKVVVLTLTQGIIDKINVKNGQTIKKGDILVKMSNPILEDTYKVYQQQINNESAQTEANLTKTRLENLTIKSPVDGVVGELYASEGSSVNEFSKVLLIYSSSEIRLQADLTTTQYQKIQKLSQVNAYSSRLNQNYEIVPGLLKAEEETPTEVAEKKIGLFFTFKNNAQATALLNNEDLHINLEDSDITNKPLDIFTDFWNGLLAKNY